MITPEFVDQDESSSVVYIRCKGGCGQLKSVEVNTNAYERWQAGQLIQRVMPELSLAERELLISGTCGECWEKIFPAEEEEEEE